MHVMYVCVCVLACTHYSWVHICVGWRERKGVCGIVTNSHLSISSFRFIERLFKAIIAISSVLK